MDHCTTPFGRRRLRQWLCRPLFRVDDIVRRQDAVAALMAPASEAAGRARRKLAGSWEGGGGEVEWGGEGDTVLQGCVKDSDSLPLFSYRPPPRPPAHPPSGVSDLERSLARLQSSTVAGAGGRESGHVVLYEDVGKRRVKALVAAIRDLQVCVWGGGGHGESALMHVRGKLIVFPLLLFPPPFPPTHRRYMQRSWSSRRYTRRTSAVTCWSG